MAKVCGICGKELGMMTAKVILKDAVLCTDCAKDLPRLSVSQDPFTLEEAKEIIRRKKSRMEYEAGGYTGPTPEYVVLQVRSFYKELHADHETGAADNK